MRSGLPKKIKQGLKENLRDIAKISKPKYANYKEYNNYKTTKKNTTSLL